MSKLFQKEFPRKCSENISDEKTNLLPAIFQQPVQINAIESITEGWFVHKSSVGMQKISAILQELYPENKYSVSEDGAFLEENGTIVACDMYKAQGCENNEKVSCWSNSIGFSEKGMFAGVGRTCKNLHTDDDVENDCPMDRPIIYDKDRYLSHEELKFPFIAFVDRNNFILLDGREITLCKEKPGKLQVKLDDKIISERHNPNKWELFQQKYPGKYLTIRLPIKGNIDESIVHQIVDEQGEEYTYWDGIILQSLPEQFTLKVEEKNHEKAIRKISQIRHKKLKCMSL
jgi:hypothetical protein